MAGSTAETTARYYYARRTADPPNKLLIGRIDQTDAMVDLELDSTSLPGTPGKLNLELQVVEEADGTRVQARIWKVDVTAPDWMLSALDTNENLLSPGIVDISAESAPGALSDIAYFDDLVIVEH